jgi:hypothetical protein
MSSMVATQPPDWQRLVDDLDRAAAGRFRDLARSLAEPDIANDRATERLDVAVERTGLGPVLDQPLHAAALLGDVGRQAEHVDIGLIADDDVGRGVVQHETLRDVVHGGAEMTPFRGERAVKSLMTLQQQSDRHGEDGDRGEQHAFAQGQGGRRHARRNAGGQHGAAESEPFQHRPCRRRD